jgi:tetratricopeptide (TPR) repeat protein
VACVLAAVLVSCARGVAAQILVSPDPAASDYDSAFQDMLRDPGNLDKTFRFARLAAETGDLEGAAAALSRLLITLPENWRVRYELGILYFRLKSYALAKSYFLSALRIKFIPAALRLRAAEFIQEIDNRTAQHRLNGSLTAGIRYQSNVNAASSVAQQQTGANAALEDSFTKKEDFDLFGSLNVRHVYDLNTIDATTVESDFLLYGAKQMSEDEFDLIFLDAHSGPSFKFQRGYFRGLSIRPFLQAEYARLGEARLYATAGAGIRLERDLGDKSHANFSYDASDRYYRDSARRPNSSNLDGIEHTLQINLTRAVTPTVGAKIRARAIFQNASAPFESNAEYAALLGLTARYAAPFELTQNSWTSIVTVEYAKARYDEANVDLEPARSRINQRWTLRFASEVPFSRELSAIFSIGYRNNGSNIANFEHDNVDVSLAVKYKL